MARVARPDSLHLAESPFTRTTDTRVRKLIEHRKALRKGERVLVAVSGGQDSTAMLLILARLAAGAGWTLAAAQFDHKLRSEEEATEDRWFVEALCAVLDVPFAAGEGDVAGRARARGEGVEEAARHLRYAFLAEQAKELGADVVAVGHTRNDRAETVMMHLLRGSGLDGLAVMDGRSSWPFGEGPDLSRPLIDLSREETGRYCEESGVVPRDDPTNELLIATRNRVRHEVMPLLRSFNPRIDEALSRLADAASRDAALLDEVASREWARLVVIEGDALRFPREELATLPPAIATRLIRLGAAALGAPAPQAEHVEQVLAVAERGRGTIELPGGVVAVGRGGELTLRRSGRAAGA